MIALKEAYEASGYHLVGATVSNQAAKVLQSESGIQSSSISKLLYELDKPQSDIHLGKKTVLLIDESGMVDTPQLARLVEHVDRSGAKLVLVGDEKQLQSIGAGGGFQAARTISQAVGADAELVQTRRQQVGWQKIAAEHLGHGRSLEALEMYESQGRLKIANGSDEAAKALVSDWIRDRTEHQGEGETQLIIVSNHAQGAQLNRLAQQALIDHGLVSKKAIVENVSTEKHGRQSLHVGDQILFRENSKGKRGIGVINGDAGKVRGLTSEGQILVQLSDGREVIFDPAEYKNWTLGYASTVHKSQGSTVDRAYYLLGSGDHREMGYVAGSRHRKDLTLYADRSVYESGKTQTENRQSLLQEIARGLKRSDEKELALTAAERSHADEGMSH